MARQPDGTCSKCGIELRPHQCTAHSKRTRKHCGNQALDDMDVCRHHGGRSPQAIAAAERRREEREAQDAAATYGLPRHIEPHVALLEELCRTAGHVAWLGDLIADGDKTTVTTATMFGVKPSVWVELYQRERKHYGDIAAACLRAGVEAAQVALAEQQGRLLVEVIGAIVTELGHDIAAEPVRQVVGRHLRLVAGSGT